MKTNIILRLLLVAFLLYIAWPMVPQSTSSLEFLFWGCWLLFAFVFIGANLATLLKMSRPPVMEQEGLTKNKQRSH
ncbi:hypothetical protein [Oceanobacillus jeddahense]|uniref:Uncharacterized protein n=1 Tax=Oceanobacillus jeddahense TaxID=1462527 RepID=A0ABY5JN47_9BACI|nr:hypothetical protein [Oceanobacillus jeddahense]UUI01731.1 hypothetical protein NP439_16975 [Oceanobacillus jeddahense]